MITATEVRDWIGVPATPETDGALQLIAATASHGVTMLADGRNIPPEVLKLAALTAASDTWERRQAPHGVRGFGPDGMPIRVTSDDLAAAKAILAPYLPPTVV